jgi:Phage integrase family
MDEWGWEHLRPWLSARAELPAGPLFCIIDGPTRGRPWSGAAVRSEFRRFAARAGVRRRFAPHQLRHAHALELACEGVPLNIIQRQLGHANLGTTSIYRRDCAVAILDYKHGFPWGLGSGDRFEASRGGSGSLKEESCKRRDQPNCRKKPTTRVGSPNRARFERGAVDTQPGLRRRARAAPDRAAPA